MENFKKVNSLGGSSTLLPVSNLHLDYDMQTWKWPTRPEVGNVVEAAALVGF